MLPPSLRSQVPEGAKANHADGTVHLIADQLAPERHVAWCCTSWACTPRDAGRGRG